MSKKIISLIVAALIFAVSALPAFAEGLYAKDGMIYYFNGTPMLYDGGNVIPDDDEPKLLNKLNVIREKYQIDVAIIVVEKMGLYCSADKYINNLYDNNGYGYGPSRDGVMLLISMSSRDYRILSNGDLGANAITMKEIDAIGEVIQPSLSSGNYTKAFVAFADKCEYYINGYINGFPFEYGFYIAVALIVGFVLAFIVTGVMKGKLKSVRRRNYASEYTKDGSMNITNSTDLYLYSVVTSQRIERSSSSSRSGSSGGSRHVGGGKF